MCGKTFWFEFVRQGAGIRLTALNDFSSLDTKFQDGGSIIVKQGAPFHIFEPSLWGIRLSLRKPKYTNLEIANQMYKDAWLVKRTLFQKKFPQLSSAELDKKTSEYFARLKDQ